MYQPGKELIPTCILLRLTLRVVEDYLPVDDEEESAIVNEMMQESPGT